MAVKVLIKRDSIDNFIANDFVPRSSEIVAAYDSAKSRVVFKIGDGKTSWTELPEVTRIDEIDRFKVYTAGKEAVEVFLKPESIKNFLEEQNSEGIKYE